MCLHTHRLVKAHIGFDKPMLLKHTLVLLLHGAHLHEAASPLQWYDCRQSHSDRSCETMSKTITVSVDIKHTNPIRDNVL